MAGTGRRAASRRGGPLDERLQIVALMVLTGVTIVLALIVLVGAFGDAGPAADRIAEDPEPRSEEVGSDATGGGPELPRVVFIGDGWAGGTGATSAENAYPSLAATQLGWTFDVDSVPGSGWTKSSPDIPASRFVDRAARLSDGANAADVVVFSTQTPSGSPLKEVAAAIEESVETVRAQVPGAMTVVVLPVANTKAGILCPPSAQDLVCIDTFDEGWLLPGESARFRDREVGAPNDDGHARLARFLANDLRRAFPELGG